jgi:hypothetical protein
MEAGKKKSNLISTPSPKEVFLAGLLKNLLLREILHLQKTHMMETSKMIPSVKEDI